MATEVYAEKVVRRFWGKVDQSGGSKACWPWTASLAGPGYGHAWTGKRQINAHRFAWILTNGPIPDGLWVLHRCDVMICCNPLHLFLGTAQDNVQDRHEKGRDAIKKGARLPWKTRSVRGEDRKNAKLTDERVREIIGRYQDGGITQRALAAEYGVHQSIISEILNGKRWPHVTGGL